MFKFSYVFFFFSPKRQENTRHMRLVMSLLQSQGNTKYLKRGHTKLVMSFLHCKDPPYPVDSFYHGLLHFGCNKDNKIGVTQHPSFKVFSFREPRKHRVPQKRHTRLVMNFLQRSFTNVLLIKDIVNLKLFNNSFTFLKPKLSEKPFSVLSW